MQIGNEEIVHSKHCKCIAAKDGLHLVFQEYFALVGRIMQFRASEYKASRMKQDQTPYTML